MPPRWAHSWRVATLVVVLSAACPSWAQAAPPRPARVSFGQRRQALKLAGEALDLYKANDYERALEKFREADALLPAPTLKIRIARCLDKLDRLAEAIETYRTIIAAELPAFAPAKHRQAREDAVDELAALLPQQPSMSVTVQGDGAADSHVTIDGEAWDDSQLTAGRKFDPGRYLVAARTDKTGGDKTGGDKPRMARKPVPLKRGEHLNVVLTLPAAATNHHVIPPPAVAGATTAGWVLLGVGGAALVASAVTGGLAAQREAELAPKCPNRVCGAPFFDDARALDRLRYSSTTTLIAGGALLVSGIIVLAATAGGDDDADNAQAGSIQLRPMPWLAWRPAAGGGLPSRGPAIVGARLQGTF